MKRDVWYIFDCCGVLDVKIMDPILAVGHEISSTYWCLIRCL